MNLSLITLITTSLVLTAAAEQPHDTPRVKVLLAMEQTEFKKKLISEMKTILEKEGMELTVVKDSEHEIKKFKAADFQLVFITNSGVWSKVRPWITEWIDANKADSAKILLHTTKQLKWEEVVYVDAVSSASQNKIAPELAREYVTKLLGKRQVE